MFLYLIKEGTFQISKQRFSEKISKFYEKYMVKQNTIDTLLDSNDVVVKEISRGCVYGNHNSSQSEFTLKCVSIDASVLFLPIQTFQTIIKEDGNVLTKFQKFQQLNLEVCQT